MAALIKQRNNFIPLENVLFCAILYTTSSVNFYETLQRLQKEHKCVIRNSSPLQGCKSMLPP